MSIVLLGSGVATVLVLLGSRVASVLVLLGSRVASVLVLLGSRVLLGYGGTLEQSAAIQQT